MLFHITHQHSEETCPAHDADRMAATFGKMMEAIKESGIDVRGFYANAGAHRVFMVVETDSIEVLNKVLYPALTIGTAKIEPVADAAATASAFEEEARK
ncbi:MAG: hypothetical protein HN368_22790 [Spirochaetales bacterium]|jgi:hypothetical protein|nr:hypothetical protein [Spirochaetales bacterium]